MHTELSVRVKHQVQSYKLNCDSFRVYFVFNDVN